MNRRSRFALSSLFVAFLFSTSPGFGEEAPRPTPVVAPKPYDRLVDELTRQAMTAPTDERDEAFLALLEQNLARFESPRSRRSLLDTLGDSHQIAGRLDRAEVF